MKKIARSLFLFFGLILFSCSSNSVQQKKVNKITKAKVVANEIFVAEVEGMVCKMGCGGAIRKEMLQTNAVSRVEIDYQEGAKKQTIKVHFDNKLISQKQLIKRIEKINKNQFKVFPIGSSEIVSSSSGSPSKSTVNMSETTIELPNLIGILSSFITE